MFSPLRRYKYSRRVTFTKFTDLSIRVSEIVFVGEVKLNGLSIVEQRMPKVDWAVL